MRRTWIKLFCDQWLRGSIRKEAIEIRAIFADLLAMAGDSAYGDDGIIQLAEDVGFTDELIAGILNIPIKIWRSAKKRLSCHPVNTENRIEIISLQQGFSMRILNWQRYQSEYQRQKPYREDKKKETSPQTPLKETKDVDREGEGEGEVTLDVTKVTTKVTKKEREELPPIPKKLPFKIQDEFRKKRAYIRSLKRECQDENKLLRRGIKKEDLLAEIKGHEKEYREKLEDYSD